MRVWRWDTHSRSIKDMSKEAENGDTEAGEKLLRMFADLKKSSENAHPVLVAHVARCLARILDEDMDPRAALCIKRPAQRPRDKGKIAARHDAALHAYCRARARKQTHEEASNTAVSEVSGLTPGVMKNVYEAAGKFKRDFLIALYTREVGT